MSVLILTSELQVGGTCRDAVEWANRLVAQDRQVVLLAQDGRGPGASRLADQVELLSLGGGRAVFAAFAFLRVLRRYPQAVILANCGALAGLAVVFRSLGLIGNRIVYVDPFNPADTFRRGCKTAWIYRRLLWRADGFVHLSAYAERYHRRLGLEASRSCTIPNLSSASRPKGGVRPVGSPPRFLAVGRLDAIKGFDRLIAAFPGIRARWPGAVLRIVGEGYDRPRLETAVRAFGLEGCVELAGHSDAVSEELRQADLFVLPSRYEGMPNTLVEALDQGCRVVATPCRGPVRSLLGELGAMPMVVDERTFDQDLIRAAEAAMQLDDAGWSSIHARHRAHFDDGRNFARLLDVLKTP